MIIVFVILRIPSLFEPAWYGDEGIYAAVAAEMKQGELLYVDTWDHKPPAIFYVYLAASIFGNNQIFVYKFFNLILGLVTLWGGYKIAFTLFDNHKEKAAINATVGFITLFLGSALLEGNIFNAENIFIPLATWGVYLLLHWTGSERSKLHLPQYWQTSLIAFLFGIALTFKIHPLFDAGLVIYLILLLTYTLWLAKNKRSSKYAWKLGKQAAGHLLVFVIYLALPIVLFAMYYWAIGHWDAFFESVVTYNFGYSEAFQQRSLGYIIFLDDFNTRAAFTTLLVLSITFAYYKHLISYRFFVTILWLVFAFFAVRLSSRPYSHYLLQIVVPTALVIGFAFKNLFNKNNQTYNFLKLSWIALFIYLFANLYTQGGQLYFGYQHPSYYPKGYLYALGLIEQDEWDKEFLGTAETIGEISLWLERFKGKEVFIYSDEAWLYPLAEVKNPVRYTVYFHINQDNANEVISALEAKQVTYLVLENKRGITEKLDAYIVANFTPIEQYDSLAGTKRDDPKLGVYSIWIRKSALSAQVDKII